ncbi:Importin-beta domain-containing protein [Pleurostoma richardsiae]|uniref:Importin-beta domain-containing protein n=1 Tax=Pleurostoma richardsiae TaxID=41990 RepID=A0AA38S0Q9_9PEZI|nr:Importin-beta domain-containing protein [Pleurostoma richardsiae]
MNFSIEVPGEANPFNLRELCRALQSATSLDNSQRQAGGQQLAAWETKPDYYPSLQSVFLDDSTPGDIRLLAIILLKNGIDKYWRGTTGKYKIKSEEKTTIRDRLFQGTIYAEDKSLALHNSLVTAKIVRIDYPQDWPHALTEIIGILRTFKDGLQAHLTGALSLLHYTVKELGTARLRRSQTALQSVTPEIVFLLIEIYTDKVTWWRNWLTTGHGDEDDADLAIQSSLMALKILRRLLNFGYEQPHQDKLVQEFWSLTQTHFGQFLGYVSHDSAVPAPYQDVVGKHLHQFTKLHLEMSEAHPASFAVLPNSIPLVHAYWDLVAKFAEVFDKSGGLRVTASSDTESKSKVEGPLLEKLALKGLLLIKNCVAIIFKPLQTFRFRSPEVKKQQDEAVSVIKTHLLTNDFVLQVVNVIISKLLIFRKADLDAWEEDPEEFESQERHLGDAWEWEVRPCAERLYLDLLVHFKALLSPPLLEYFQTAAKADADVITKEAIYTAMGSAAPNLYEVFDFDSFLPSTIVQDAQYAGPLAKVLRRRISILLSLWVPIKIADRNRHLIFGIYRHFMNPKDKNNDEVVRITAARQMKWIAEDFNFPTKYFLPYASDLFGELINLLQEINVEETKLAVIETLRIFVSIMETDVTPFGDQVMDALPLIWQSAGEDSYMLKQAVLSVLAALVMSMGENSQRYQHSMLPLVRDAMNPKSPDHMFIVDDTADLWKAIMSQSSPPLLPELVDLYDYAVPLVEYVSSLADDGLEIVKSYIALAPEAVLSDKSREKTLASLDKSMDVKTREQVYNTEKCLEYIIRAAADMGGATGLSVVVADMWKVGFLPKVFKRIHEAWEAHQTTGPKKKTPISSILESDYFAILSRIAIADPVVFIKLLESVADLGSIWSWLSEEWFSSFDSMADNERQKLCCLALTRLLELPDPVQSLALGKLQDYFSMWTSVVTDVQDGNATGADQLVWTEVPRSEFDTAQDTAFNVVTAEDPIHTVHTFSFIRERLEDLVRRVGGEQQFEMEWAVNVDKHVLAGFQELSNPRPRDIEN